MKSFKQFIQESVNIQHVDTLIVNNAESSPASVGEEFSAEYLQGEYPGAIVQQIYVTETSNNSIKITGQKRYHPAKLDWV